MTRTPDADHDDLPDVDFTGPSDWRTRVWERIDRRERLLSWLVPALVLAVGGLVALYLYVGGAP